MDTFGVNMLAVAEKKPETLSLRQIIKYHVDFQFETNTRKYKYLLEKEEEKKEVYDTFYYLTPSKANEDLSELVASYTDDGVKNLAIAGLSNTIFSYSLKGKFYTRNDTANDNTKLIGDVAKKTNLVLEQPVSYLWKDTNAFLDMPLGSSDYMYVDEEIPFLSMVLKGIIPMYSNYVNFEANKQEFLLQMVEAGVYPSFYVTYENS